MRENKRIIHVLVAICLLFFALIAYLTYFEVFIKGDILSNSYNRRLWQREEEVTRGRIYDCSGVLLADSVKTGSKPERIYPYGRLYSHVIGYNSITYGKALLEAAFNDYLLDIKGRNSIFKFKDRLDERKEYGYDLHLTIDHRLQELARELIGSRNGAVVAMNPKTGEILAMVSKPDFDPNNKSLNQKWEDLVESEDHPFLPRATQGLYTPGSTFKTVVSAAAIENGMKDIKFEDKGTVTIDGKKIRNTNGKAYGTIDLTRALAVSSNVAFSQIGVKLGNEGLHSLAERIGMGKEIPFDIHVNKSRFPYGEMGKTDMAAVGMGQGKMLVTPLHMAMLTSSIANKGVMMKPILVRYTANREGLREKEWKPSRLYYTMSSLTAYRLRKMMEEVVKNGTGKNAAIKGISVAGKTGTAENELTADSKDKQHAWFIAFAPADDPEIAVAVVLEYSGSTGGKLAAPIARDIIKDWLAR